MHRSLSGAAAAATTLALAVGAPAARAGDPIMPLSDVKPGMQCQGRTVISGIEPVPFDATVISVEGGPRPIDAQILVRVSGEGVAVGGIAEGDSGSPIYCPGADGVMRVIGAVAYGIGQYDNTVGGVTPIEAMLSEPTITSAPAAPVIGITPGSGAGSSSASTGKTSTAATSKKARKTKAKASAAKASTTRKTSKTATATTTTTTKTTSTSPLATDPNQIPLMLSGPRGALAARFTNAAAKAGIRLIASPQASAYGTAPDGGYLKPGDAVQATQVFGDVSAGAIGTVTYVDGPRVYAFGHPFNGTGPARLQMERAQISTIIDSPSIADQASYKQGSALGPVGTIGFDGTAGITGLLGAAPASIPVAATIKDASGTVIQQANANVVDERGVRGGGTGSLLGLAAAANAGTALQRLTTQQAVGGAARACTTIFLKNGLKPLSECVDSVTPQPSSDGGVETGAAGAVSAAIDPLTTAERFLDLVDHVQVDITYRKEADDAEIVKVIVPSHPQAGSTVTARVIVVQGSSGARREIPVKLKIPRAAAGERTGLVITGDTIDTSGNAASSDSSSSDAIDLTFSDDDGTPAPKSVKGLRSLYTTDGESGLRAIIAPGTGGKTILDGIEGSEDSQLSDDEVAAYQATAKLVWELPAVQLSGGASATITPR
ncbi:MAG: hypothetical protein AAGC46_01415 [Solirubrobacteraceae bacterium]|nr:hypothetical protein [Patulibacter sp.]